MAEEEKVVETKEEKKEEKKENGFSKFFKKIGKSISDSNREDKLAKAYRSRNGVQEFSIYTDSDSLFSIHTYYGTLDEGKKEVTLYTEVKEDDVPFSSVLSTIADGEKELPRRFYLLDRRVENIDIEIEEKDDKDNVIKNTYSRPVTVFTIDPDMKEVQVIKVKNTYYLKHEGK